MILRFVHGRKGDDGLASAERALALDANLAEAHAVKARILAEHGRHDEAAAEIDIALRLDPESYEVNRAAAYLRFRQQRLDEAIRYYEKSMTLMETDLNSAPCCSPVTTRSEIPRPPGVSRAITLARAEKTAGAGSEQRRRPWATARLLLAFSARANGPRNGSTARC